MGRYGLAAAAPLAGLLLLAALRGPAAPPPASDTALEDLAVPVENAAVAHVPERRWSVRVDGWTIELGDVAGRAVPELRPAIVPPVLSPYDEMIARYALAAGLDWRLVSAVIFEESRFDPDSESSAGAVGLMQVMPAAAQDVGELRFQEPEANVRTGVRYLQRLAREYAAAPERDRLALMLAAYNMGMGHVRDAQVLARRFGYDPLRWDGAMDVMVSLLEEPSIAAAARNGYAQGRSVVGYVDRVLTRYTSYLRTLPVVPPNGLG
ncbi:MAG: transglycosylase SLT domain-containing protein [Deltaproteobacteria bacterium]|nr:transglycosylase SLT domain-containing protein [Deltaproteobacteria bacterium]